MELINIYNGIKKEATEVKIYLKPTIIFLFLGLFISVPLYYFSLLANIVFVLIYHTIITYFIIIISISLSYYYCFKDEWKFRITTKLIIGYILLYQIIIYYAFGLFNNLFGINSPDLGIFIISPFFLFLLDYVSIPPVKLTKWIFRSFDGNGLTYEKEMDSFDFKHFVQLMAGTYIEIRESILIHGNLYSNPPSFFLRYDKEKCLTELQVSRKKWFSFVIDEKTKKFGHLFESFGFKYVGEKVINNDLFIPKHNYPIFSKSRFLGGVWIFLSVFSLSLIVSERNKFMFFEFPGKLLVYYSQFNGIAKENPLVIAAVFFILGLLINKFQYIQSIYENWLESLKKL